MRFERTIIIYGVLLITVSVISAFIAPGKNISLLIPGFFGGMVVVLGIMSLRNDLQKFGRHGATGISLVAFLSGVDGFKDLWFFLRENPGLNLYVILTNCLMAFISIIFLIYAVRSFIAERSASDPDIPGPTD